MKKTFNGFGGTYAAGKAHTSFRKYKRYALRIDNRLNDEQLRILYEAYLLKSSIDIDNRQNVITTALK